MAAPNVPSSPITTENGGTANVSPAQAQALADLKQTLEQAFTATIQSSIIQADLNTGKQIAQGAAGR